LFLVLLIGPEKRFLRCFGAIVFVWMAEHPNTLQHGVVQGGRCLAPDIHAGELLVHSINGVLLICQLSLGQLPAHGPSVYLAFQIPHLGFSGRLIQIHRNVPLSHPLPVPNGLFGLAKLDHQQVDHDKTEYDQEVIKHFATFLRAFFGAFPHLGLGNRLARDVALSTLDRDVRPHTIARDIAFR
jgi:hypothetical protein